MNPAKALDLSDCAREPIHIPGAIQPYGVLLVVDESDIILQAGGEIGPLLGFSDAVVGCPLQEVVGPSLPQLLRMVGTNLGRRPISLGRISTGSDTPELIALAQKAREGTIIELQSAGPRVTADRVLAQMQVYAERMSTGNDLIGACNVAVKGVRKAVGYDRVMIYQFLNDGSGAVIAEDRESHLPAFLNHRYPGSDIPAQARALYRDNPVRVVPDVGYVPSPVLPEISPVTGEPLDMSHCLLRSVSPVHIRYLKNMEVGASMSVSLIVNGELWGLIACQNATPKPVPYESLEICNHLGQLLASDIRVREEMKKGEVARALHHARERVLLALEKAQDPASRLFDLGPELQAMARSHGMAVVSADHVAIVGQAPTEAQARKLAMWLEEREGEQDAFATESLSEIYPDAGAFAANVSGMLSVVLPCESPVVLMWFRVEQVEEINWAGNPHEPSAPGEDAGSLNPRSSFAAWTETVRNRSRPWEQIDLQSAQEFATRALSTLRRHRIASLNRELELANARLERLALLDGLTGIANRRAFDERLQIEWARAQRTGEDLGLIILDLDFFKEYNDLYGHGMGDECLRQVAGALQTGIRTTDLVARIGGEEFAIILAGGSLKGAARAAEMIRARIETLGLPHAESPMGVVTASAGFAALKAAETNSPESFMASADKALYWAKRDGRNRVCGSRDADDLGPHAQTSV